MLCTNSKKFVSSDVRKNLKSVAYNRDLEAFSVFYKHQQPISVKICC